MPKARLNRVSTAAALLLGTLLLCAADPPDIAIPAGPQQRNFTVKSNGLTILPGQEVTSMTFGSGVAISGASFSLTAASVEIRIDAGEGISFEGGLKLPEALPDRDSVPEEPGDIAAQMARELELPQARFSRSGIKYVGATGGVTVSTQGITMSTPTIASADGGRSWSAEGRTTIARSAAGENYRLAADHLLYDTQTQRAAARGNIVATMKRGGEAPIELAAERIELNVKSGQLTVSDGIRASFGDMSFSGTDLSGNVNDQTLTSSGELTATYGTTSMTGSNVSADLEGRRLTATGGTRLVDSRLGLTLDADRLSVDLGASSASATGNVTLRDSERNLTVTAGEVLASTDGGNVTASGTVTLTDAANGVKVTAGRVVADVKGRKLTATGSPTVVYRDSTFTGETIVVSQQGGRTVVEVSGRQEAKVDVDALEQAAADLQQDAAGGEADTAAPAAPAPAG